MELEFTKLKFQAFFFTPLMKRPPLLTSKFQQKKFEPIWNLKHWFEFSQHLVSFVKKQMIKA